jgi:hypothetical protein
MATRSVHSVDPMVEQYFELMWALSKRRGELSQDFEEWYSVALYDLRKLLNAAQLSELEKAMKAFSTNCED